MAVRYIVVKWNDDTYSTQSIKDICYKNFECGASISRQVKNESWEGEFVSTWDK